MHLLAYPCASLQDDPVPFDYVEHLTRLKLRFEDGVLKIDKALEAEDDIFENVSAIILYLWRLKTFNEARFLTVGQVAKTLTIAALTGFSACVKETRSNPQHSDYHLHGWNRIEGPLKELVPLAAFVSAVPDSALAETLEDDRIAVRLDEFKNTLETEST